jgi:hypothetical protein
MQLNCHLRKLSIMYTYLFPVCGCRRTCTINKSFASACHNPTKVPSPLVPGARSRTRGLLPSREQSSKSNSCIISTAIKAKRAFYARVVERGKSEQDGYPQRALPLSLSCSCSRVYMCAAKLGQCQNWKAAVLSFVSLASVALFSPLIQTTE